MVLHLQKHLFHVEKPKLAGAMLPQRVQLAAHDARSA
jgi:hypothetical protein